MSSDPARPGLGLRVGVVGARMRHQGLGHHLARFAAEAGAKIVGIVGTTPTTRSAAVEALASRGIPSRAFPTVEALVDDGRPDLLVVASPSRAHEEALRVALDARLHVLCEKPLLWGDADPGARARVWVEAFLATDRHLVVNAQWPYTLPTWRRLFPGVLDHPPETFAMHLAPDRGGPETIPEALPHALSLLAAVAPDPDAKAAGPVVEIRDAQAESVDVRFDYVAARRTIRASVAIRRGRRSPRPAAYGFDGRLAHRDVQVEGYRLHLEGDGRRLPLPDPVPLLVRDVLARVSSGTPPRPDPNAWPGTAHLATVARAWPPSSTP